MFTPDRCVRPFFACRPSDRLSLRGRDHPAGQKAAPSRDLKPSRYNKENARRPGGRGLIAPAGLGDSPYDIDPDGKIRLNPGTEASPTTSVRAIRRSTWPATTSSPRSPCSTRAPRTPAPAAKAAASTPWPASGTRSGYGRATARGRSGTSSGSTAAPSTSWSTSRTPRSSTSSRSATRCRYPRSASEWSSRTPPESRP